MYPKRCKECRKIHYTSKINEVPEKCSECGSTGFIELTKICCLIPLQKDGNNVTSSPKGSLEVPGGNNLDPEMKWQTACNAKTMPVNATNQPLHCTCFLCVKYLTENNLMNPEPVEDEEIELTNTVVTFDTPPPNPFQPPQ